MSDRYTSYPIVYPHFPGGHGGVNNSTRTQMFGNPIPYRPGVETPLGQLLSTHASLRNVHLSELSFRNPMEERSLLGVPNRLALQSSQDSDTETLFSDPGGLFRRAVIRSAFVQARNVSDKEESPSEEGRASQKSDNDTGVITRSGITLYGEVRDLFEHEPDPEVLEPEVHVIIKCPICSEKLRFFHPTNPDRFPDSLNGGEQLTVLACGHMIGIHCLLGWMTECAQRGREPTCPMCRFNLLHPLRVCRHVIGFGMVTLGEPLPPLTIPEGGRVPAMCKPCYRDAHERVYDRTVWGL